MGFSDSLNPFEGSTTQDIGNPFSLLDPFDIAGNRGAEGITDAAQSSADTLRGFSDVSQANLQPFLDLSNQQLPGLEASASPGGFFDEANALRPLVSSLSAPIVEERTRDLSSQLGQRGLTRSGFAAQSAADIKEDTDLSLLLQLSDMLQNRRGTVAGFGSNSGRSLAQLGQRSAEQLGSIQSQGILGAQGVRAAGQQNLIGLAGAGAGFFNQPSSNINQDLANATGTITPRR